MTGVPGASATEALAALFVLASFSVLARTRLESHVRTYAAQGVILALLAAIGAVETGDAHLAAAAALTVVVKVAVVPRLLLRLIERLGARREVESYLTASTSLLAGGALGAVAWAAAARAVPAGAGGPAPLAAALTGLLVGLLVAATRRKAVTQLLGLLLMENGIHLAAVTTARGMPMLVEVGVAFDLLLTVIALGILALRMRRTFGDVDVARLRELRG